MSMEASEHAKSKGECSEEVIPSLPGTYPVMSIVIPLASLAVTLLVQSA